MIAFDYPNSACDTYIDRYPWMQIQAFERTGRAIYHLDNEAARNHYEAIGRSRQLARGELPEPFVSPPTIARGNPLHAHLARCPARRPRLSLLQRVRAEMARRAT